MKTPAAAAVIPETSSSNSRLTGDSDAAADFAMDLPASMTLQSTVGGHSRLEGGHSRLERFDSLARGESSDGVRHTRWACLSSTTYASWLHDMCFLPTLHMPKVATPQLCVFYVLHPNHCSTSVLLCMHVYARSCKNPPSYSRTFCIPAPRKLRAGFLQPL